MKIEIRSTLDGSHTLYLEELDEHYHSTYGAIQESRHVFIQSGLEQCESDSLNVLEIGFGTGLNCYLTLLSGLKTGRKIHYYTLEKFPLEKQIWEKLNFEDLAETAGSKMFTSLHEATWGDDIEIHPNFLLHKIKADILQFQTGSLPMVDLIYYDAFSPDKQSELWDRPIFEELYNRMNENGILVTYCAKGIVRRTLQSVGFIVERIPGPPGKREMIRARKVKNLG